MGKKYFEMFHSVFNLCSCLDMNGITYLNTNITSSLFSTISMFSHKLLVTFNLRLQDTRGMFGKNILKF